MADTKKNARLNDADMGGGTNATDKTAGLAQKTAGNPAAGRNQIPNRERKSRLP